LESESSVSGVIPSLNQLTIPVSIRLPPLSKKRRRRVGG
jgi:hypothetical protein